MIARLAARVIPPLGRLRRALIEQSERIAALNQRVRELLGRLKEQERLLSLATDGSVQLHEQARSHRAVTRRASLLGRSQLPIVVGPWCGEVGFELLYWIPFVRWMVERGRIDGERLLVVTRGGASVWYHDMTRRGVEIFDLTDTTAFRNHAETWKQHRVSRFDRQLIAAALAESGVRRVRLLHPQIMYRLMTAYWKEHAVLEPIASFLRYGPLPRPSHAVTATLPAQYLAAKFYFSQSFPDTAANRTFVQRTVARAADEMPVILLTAGAQIDDHLDVTLANGAGVRILPTGVGDNLAAQSAVVAGARRFIGTYGGFSYLAPMYGVDSLSFFSARDKLVPFHLEHAQRVFGANQLGRFVALDVADARVLSLTHETVSA
jgi:hypothetical protein